MTHANKPGTNVIATCINRVCNFVNGKNKGNIYDLNQLLEATKQIVERNRDKTTKEATEPLSTNLDKSLKRNRDKATEEVTEPSSTESSPDTNPFKWARRSMQRI